MVQRVLLIAVAALIGCGGERVSGPPHIECRVVHDQCPSNADLAKALDIFAETFSEFDVEAPLTVEWHAYGEAFRRLPDGRSAAAETPSGKLTRVTSWGGLAHELVHVQQWREGRVDYDHAKGDGVWTEADDRGIDRVQDDYDRAFGPGQ